MECQSTVEQTHSTRYSDRPCSILVAITDSAPTAAIIATGRRVLKGQCKQRGCRGMNQYLSIGLELQVKKLTLLFIQAFSRR